MRVPHDRNIAILVVEDEFLIRVDTTSFLESEGFMVFEAEHAAEAIRCLEGHGEIRLIFTDVNMPGSMDGLALAHYVRGRWPPVKIIVTSGYERAGNHALPVDALFVEKPYVLKNIASKINALLAA
jgi:two-component system, response regulator PdtaR